MRPVTWLIASCELDPSRIATWYSPDLVLRLSSAAAGLLHEEKKLDIGLVEPLRTSCTQELLTR